MNRSNIASLFRALTAFEAASRRGSLSAAARELGIAQSAISRHVARLEARVGQRLIERKTRGIALTEAGRFLAGQMDAALVQLSAALEALTSRSGTNITIASSHDIASMWLIPRLNRFRSKYPGVEIRLIVGDDYTQFENDDVDVSLRFGKGEWSGWQSVRLFDEEVYAVCAPALIARHRELRLLRSPSDILAAPLIHITPSRGVDWYYWFKALGSRAPRPSAMSYPSYLTSLDAAANGEGVALCWKWLDVRFAERGGLERLGPWTVKGDDSLYLLYRPSPKPEIQSLVDFMESLAAESGPLA